MMSGVVFGAAQLEQCTFYPVCIVGTINIVGHPRKRAKHARTVENPTLILETPSGNVS